MVASVRPASSRPEGGCRRFFVFLIYPWTPLPTSEA